MKRRYHLRMFRLAGAGRDRLRPGPWRPVCVPGRRKHRRRFSSQQSRDASARFGSRLVAVLGHSQCGAVLATLEELQKPTDSQSRNLRSIVDRVPPSVEALLATELSHDPDALVRHAVRANIRASEDHLRQGSEVLEQLIQEDGLVVVGAEYLLGTGVVEFFDGTGPRSPDRRLDPAHAVREPPHDGTA